MISGVALEVARAIPAEYLPGLINGIYKLHGGVLRDGAGRIVAHLVMPELARSVTSLVPGLNVISDLITTGQLMALGRSVEQIRQSVEAVLTTSVAGAALSGLGLVTSIGGFAYLNRRLVTLDAKLSRLQDRIKKIEDLLKARQKAELHAALDTLHQADQLPRDASLRRDLLLQCKKDFGTLAHYYREVWVTATVPEEIDGADEFYALSFTGAAYAASELGLGKVVAEDFRKHLESWSVLARQHAEKQMVAGDLGRLMDAELVEMLPAEELVELLDFACGKSKGVAWFDDLRRAPISMTRTLDPFKRSRIERERPKIETARRLRARHQVLDSTAAHFSLLAGAGLSVSGFERKVGQVSATHGSDPLMIRLKTGS